MLIDEGKHRHITLAELKERIGLTTNVSNKTKIQFGKRIASILEEKAKRELRKEKAREK